MAEFDTRVLVPITSAMRDAIDAEAGPRGRSDFIRSAIEARLSGVVPKVADLSDADRQRVAKAGPGRAVVRSKAPVAGSDHPRFAAVASAIRKRGRSTVRQIVLDTGMTDMAVESALKKMRVSWPQPGVVELLE